MNLYRETICEHGLLDVHDWYTSKPLTHKDVPWPWFDGDCSGGSREEVTIDQLVFMVANACASQDMQSGPFDMLAELGEDVAGVYRRFAQKHVDAALRATEVSV